MIFIIILILIFIFYGLLEDDIEQEELYILITLLCVCVLAFSNNQNRLDTGVIIGKNVCYSSAIEEYSFSIRRGGKVEKIIVTENEFENYKVNDSYTYTLKQIK